MRDVTAVIDKAIPDDERVIALDRVLANLDKSQIVPKNVEGIKADPPDLLQRDTGGDRESRWRTDLEPDQGNDLEFAVNTNWDLFQHVPPTPTIFATTTMVEGRRPEGPLVGGWYAPRELQEVARGRQLEGRQSEPARKTAPDVGRPRVFVSFQPGELILLTASPATSWSRAPSCCG